ncbi:hypothetical protein FE257_006996 [Aspergillus nanangensis]|uniref:Rhodopsin domain-containing protein n=1 Tax=Aspergillus nanangensis TaxID=2582783 RepID=A0AAD4GUI3_ASPNN|nr:hypothetical protein FE257_006996 [Aspergillus nanangensis]
MDTEKGNLPQVADDSHLGIILGIQTALTALSVTVICLRLYVRMKIVRSSGSDDWTMTIAALCSIGGWILYVYKGCHGVGHHIQYIDPLDSIKINQATFWQCIICSSAGIAFLKISIALNLLRFSPARWYAISLWLSIGFVSAYSFMASMTFFLHCRPMKAHWDYQIEGAKCYSVHLFIVFALINTSFNIFTDVLFATIPIPIVWNLQMRRRVRLYLIGVFSLGYIAVGMGVVKAVFQLAFATNMDASYDDSILFWALAQFNTGIIAACVPSLRPLVGKVLKLSEYTESRSRGVYGSGAADRWPSSRNSRRLWSAHRGDQYALEELHSSDRSTRKDSNEAQSNNPAAYGSTATVIASGEGKRFEEEGGGRVDERQRTRGGILKTTQCTVVSARAVG